MIAIQFQLLCSQDLIIRGYIIDAISNDSISMCSILCIPSNTSFKTDKNGYFFGKISLREKTILVISHPMYEELRYPILTSSSDTITIEVALNPTSFSTKTVLVEDEHYHSGIRQGESDLLLSGSQLRKSLSPTVGETMKNLQGVSVQSMGASTSRPVVRGLGADRVLILEDGQKSGDLSATSADHAVSIDPLTVDHIEVIRGPMALLYSSNVVGGIVNITRNSIPSIFPASTQGSATFFGETVSSLYSATGRIEIPISTFSLRSDLSFKNQESYQTPIGVLPNTQSSIRNGSLGVSHFGSYGFAGLGFSMFSNDYGIPPDSINGHPKGVTVSMQKSKVEAKSEIILNDSFFKHIEILGSFIDYSHQEIESSGRIGMSFSVFTSSLLALSRLNYESKERKTTVGFWFENRNFTSGGLTFTPNSVENAFAFMAYHSEIFGNLKIDAALRFDTKSIQPISRKDSSVAGFVNNKFFSNGSGSVEINYTLTESFSSGIIILRSFRSPLTEELFSEGPHLAAYSYEVGNALLKEEIGNAFELFSTFTTDVFFTKVSVYANYFSNFIIPVNTGQRSLRRNDLFLYRFIGEDALFFGYEIHTEYQIHPNILVSANSYFTNARFTKTNTFVPRIPPLLSKFECTYKSNAFQLSLSATNALEQNNLGEFETKTPGYTLYDISSQYHFQWNSTLHTVSFSLLNITNTLYRNHLNRIKDLFPEQGRNARLLYSIFI